MSTPSADVATVQALRTDVAFQVARHLQRLGVNQVSAAKRLGIPQPTLSKIANGRVSDLSLELLIRITVRAGLPITLLTGWVPEEAGAFLSNTLSQSSQRRRSRLADEARESLLRSERRLTPSQRLEAFLEHNQLLGAIHQYGEAAGAHRARIRRTHR